MSLPQKILNVVAAGLTLASLAGIPAYASNKDLKPMFGKDASIAFEDFECDGLTDMVVGGSSKAIYFKDNGDGELEYKQTIYSSKIEGKIDVMSHRINGRLYLIVMAPFEFRMYTINKKGIFEEVKEIRFVDDLESSSLPDIKD